MRDLSWLKRPFDARCVYVLGGILVGVAIPLLVFEILPIPFIRHSWAKVGIFFAMMLWSSWSRSRRRHTAPRGFGWVAAGAGAGCFLVSFLTGEAVFVLPLMVILAIFAYALLTEWRERDLQEE